MNELFETCLIRGTVCQGFDKAIANLIFVHTKFFSRKKGGNPGTRDLENLFEGFSIVQLNKFIRLFQATSVVLRSIHREGNQTRKG